MNNLEELSEHPLVLKYFSFFPYLTTQHLCEEVFMEDPWMFAFFAW